MSEENNKGEDNVVSLDAYREKKERFNKPLAQQLRWHPPDTLPNNEDSDSFLKEIDSIGRKCVSDLSDIEIEKIIFLSVSKSGELGVEEQDCINILDWANKAIVNYNALCLAISGHIAFKWDGYSNDVVPFPID